MADLEPSDAQLLDGARRGDGSAFGQLVERHASGLYRVAVSLVGNAADAEDVVQETLAGAYRGMRGFRGSASVRTWLTQILVRQAARHHRTMRVRRAESLDARPESPPAPPTSGATVGAVDARIDLTEALAALTEEHRQVLVMRELQGLRYEEMAAALGVPRGTIESRLFRARQALREQLGADFAPDPPETPEAPGKHRRAEADAKPTSRTPEPRKAARRDPSPPAKRTADELPTSEAKRQTV